MSDQEDVTVHTETRRSRERRAYRSPAKSPVRRLEAEEITSEVLDRSVNGRRANFETRMAMQRELDSARAQLRHSEKECDELRRQAVSHREEAAMYRSENLKVTEELKSCRARLNAALDSQQEMLRKNADKHDALIESQNNLALIKDELAVKENRVLLLEEELASIQGELKSHRSRAGDKERTLESKVSSLTEDVAVARERLATISAENESLRAQVDVLRREIGLKDELGEQLRRQLQDTDAELAEYRDALRQAESRISTMESEHVTAHDTIRELEIRVESYRANEDSLHSKLAERDHLLSQLQQDKENNEKDLKEARSRLNAQQKSLDMQLSAQRQREKLLVDDLKNMQRFVGRSEMRSSTEPSLSSSSKPCCSGCGDGKSYTYRKTTTRTTSSSGGNFDAPRSSRMTRYMSLAREREEAERLASDARRRLRSSLREW